MEHVYVGWKSQLKQTTGHSYVWLGYGSHGIQWDVFLWLGIHSYNIHWNMVLFGLGFHSYNIKWNLSFGWEFTATSHCVVVFVVVDSQLHHTIEHGFLWFWAHWYTSQWKLSFGWEPIASTYNGTCFFCRESTVAADDEHLFRGVGNHRYDIQWVMFFFGWEFTATAYNGIHWRGIHRSNKQWNTFLRLRMHGYSTKWDMISLVGHS